MFSSGHVTHITVLDLSTIVPGLEEIDEYFDEPVSIEALCADYLATLYTLEATDTAETMLLEDYGALDMFVSLTDDALTTVHQQLLEFFHGFWSLLMYNAIEINARTPWQVLGRRGKNHLLLVKTLEETP